MNTEERNKEGILVEDAKSAKKLTRDMLAELEQKEKSPARRALDFFISVCPMLAAALAAVEYIYVPNFERFVSSNANPERYLIFLAVPAAIYFFFWLHALVRHRMGQKKYYWNAVHKAPLYSVLFLALSALDLLTLKSGKLLYPFIPWVNDIINAAIGDWPNLLKSCYYSLELLFTGYFIGVAAGLVTGIACGYSERVNYWINPIVKVLGPIPTATWLPLIMIIVPNLHAGALFIISLGTWFAVTLASRTGIQNVDRSLFDAARILGAKGHQLVFRVAIPSAMPNILQGMTQGMSSACISLMVAEMMGVEAGLGWYMTWAKSWALYNRMFAALIVLVIIFNAVTNALNAVKKHALRWQNGVK